MIESYNRFMIEVEKAQRERLKCEAFESRMAEWSLRKELGMTKRLLYALGRQFISVGQKLQRSAQFESIEVYVPAMNAD
jgi:hypothetical protein